MKLANATQEARTATPNPPQTAYTETEFRTFGSAFTDTLLGVSLRGLDDTQVLGKRLVAELLRRGLQIVPTDGRDAQPDEA